MSIILANRTNLLRDFQRSYQISFQMIRSFLHLITLLEDRPCRTHSFNVRLVGDHLTLTDPSQHTTVEELIYSSIYLVPLLHYGKQITKKITPETWVREVDGTSLFDYACKEGKDKSYLSIERCKDVLMMKLSIAAFMDVLPTLVRMMDDEVYRQFRTFIENNHI